MLIFNLNELKRIFGGNIATKIVTKTDLSKDAYVVTVDQRKVLSRAGFKPGSYPNTATVPLNILGTSDVVNASYYGSRRVGSGRVPEYRMGRFLDRLNINDEIAFATDTRDIFICKISRAGEVAVDVRKAYEETAINFNESIDINELIKRAKAVKQKPERQSVQTTTYYRDPAVIALAHRRSEFKCEMPGCKYAGFEKYGGGQFIETHHIKPLSEKGEDSIFNVAALCPTCHRKVHFANERKQMAQGLREAVHKANERLGIKSES